MPKKSSQKRIGQINGSAAIAIYLPIIHERIKLPLNFGEEEIPEIYR